MIIDLTTEEEYATFPLTQLSEKEPSAYELTEKESIAYEHEMYGKKTCGRILTNDRHFNDYPILLNASLAWFSRVFHARILFATTNLTKSVHRAATMCYLAHLEFRISQMEESLARSPTLFCARRSQHPAEIYRSQTPCFRGASCEYQRAGICKVYHAPAMLFSHEPYYYPAFSHSYFQESCLQPGDEAYYHEPAEPLLQPVHGAAANNSVVYVDRLVYVDRPVEVPVTVVDVIELPSYDPLAPLLAPLRTTAELVDETFRFQAQPQQKSRRTRRRRRAAGAATPLSTTEAVDSDAEEEQWIDTRPMTLAPRPQANSTDGLQETHKLWTA